MKYLVISTALSGRKSRRASQDFYQLFQAQRPEDEVKFIDLHDKNIQFSDGRNYLDYDGDTLELLTAIMESDGIVFCSPIFQASISAPLKNIFDLLPIHALEGKVVGLILIAGSPRHYLVGETQIKPILSYMYASILSKYVYIHEADFNADGQVSDSIQFRFKDLIDDLKNRVEANQYIQAQQMAFFKQA